MVKELIFILIIIVVILAFIARGPKSILHEESAPSIQDATSSTNVQGPSTSPIRENLTARKRNKTAHVRFSPEKKERVYNVKTGEIVGEHTVPVEESEN